MRTTKIVGFSVPPKIEKKIAYLAKSKLKTKSELFREILNAYTATANHTTKKKTIVDLEENNLAKILKKYWQLKSAAKDKTIIIICLAIIVKGRKILIGARREKDKWVENLSWVFPGGKINSLDFEKEVKETVLRETGLKIIVKNLIAARIIPDSGFKPVQVVALYFHCQIVSSQKETPGGDLAILKWVRPTEVFKYFTTSTCDDVTKFLITIEKG